MTLFAADILAADRQLAIEIEFDLRKFEEKQAEEEEQRRSQKERGSNPVTPTVNTDMLHINERETCYINGIKWEVSLHYHNWY